ncbi:PD-(D/E)XK nuclease family protein [Bacteroidales bacterium OttesenSCG-928-M11]|nr:PD-(D/E)XK nuclease family protein [Bacteroidales bacterium OttesenSCG-928-M11]
MKDNCWNNTFLSLVAKDLIGRFGTDLSKVNVVFPSIRASLFFNNCLSRYVQKPLWAPKYSSIDSIFEQVTDIRKGDSILLIGELYQAYIKVYNKYASSPSSETLDEFFFFGEVLLNDFNDIDKNLVNPHLLFSNLQDLDQLKDDFSHLSPEQLEALQQRFALSFQGDTPLKNAFWNIWNILGEVYQEFQQRLRNKQIAYSGMLMRSVVESEEILFRDENYAFVGFNVLNKCEEEIFVRLKDRSVFYWDYDKYYINTEAGRFIKKNIRRFGSALDADVFDSFLSFPKQITFAASPSETGQASIIPTWIDSLRKQESFSNPDTAIVLCNEGILPTVMHSIPSDKVKDINITMGFPITQTPISSFLSALTEMQTVGYLQSSKTYRYRFVLPVLRHPYTQLLFPEAKEVEQEILKNNVFFPDIKVLRSELLFSYADTPEMLAKYLLTIVQQLGFLFGEEQSFADPYKDLYNESIFRSFQVLNRLYGLLTTENWEIEKITFLRLIKKLLSTVKIPFHGEPVKGLQIMGVLETRTLDFRHLLMLSTNEGFMPGGSSDNSFIPEFLRKHFGLSTLDHQDAIYAYYFYRLIQRAETITLVYNTDKTQTGKAEISRFLLQMLIEPQLQQQIKRFTLKADVQPWQGQSISVPKDKDIMDKIHRLFDLSVNPDAKVLSPTALNTYISCSFKFYQQYIQGIKAPNEMSDELDNSVFGTIFHRAAELLYKQIGHIPESQKRFNAFEVQVQHLEPYLTAPHLIEKLVTRAFACEFFKKETVSMEDFDGQQLIKHKIICHLIKRLVNLDKQRAPFTIHGLEYWLDSPMSFDQEATQVKVGGIIDRLEEKEGKFYIVDYKSSGSAKNYKTIAELFEQKDKRAPHVFQTFVYATLFIAEKNVAVPVIPALIYLQNAAQENYSPVISYNKSPIEDFRNLYLEFEDELKTLLSQLFDPCGSFCQTDIRSTCEYCDFREMCNR